MRPEDQTEGHFTELTPAERERLVRIAEEMAEVAIELGKTGRTVAKVLRHGWLASARIDGEMKFYSNRNDLEREIRDLMQSLWRLAHNGDIDPSCLAAMAFASISNKYMHHQDQD